MSTRILGIGLVTLCLSGGCDGTDSSRGTATSGGLLDQADESHGEAAPDAYALPERARELSLEDALEELEYLSASDIAYGSEEFRALSEIIVRNGNREVFSQLLTHNNPVVRAVGLSCFAQTDRTTAVDLLKAHLCDQGDLGYAGYVVEICVFGDMDYGADGFQLGYPNRDSCGYGQETIGSFARKLLRNSNCLGPGKLSPLLAPTDMLRLDLEILTDDAATAAHLGANSSIVMAFEEGVLEIDSQSLRQLSERPFYLIIKAIGRIEGACTEWNGYPVPGTFRLREAVARFLIQQLNDPELDANSHLAAASALTRFPTRDSEEVLRKHESFLNSLNEQALGTRFLATIEKHAEYGTHLDELRGQDWQFGRRELHSLLSEMRQFHHPFAITSIVEHCDWCQQQQCEAVGECLVEIARDIAKYQAPWDTYSNVAFELNSLCHPTGADLRYSAPQIPEIAKDSIMQAIEPFLADQR